MGTTTRAQRGSTGGGGSPTGPAGGSLDGTYPNPSISNNAVGEAEINDLSGGNDGEFVASDGAGKFKYVPGATVAQLQDVGDVPNYPADSILRKLSLQGGTLIWANDQEAVLRMPFVKARNLNGPQSLETHSSFNAPSCYTVGGAGIIAELLGVSLCATTATAGVGQDLDIRFYEFTATGAPRGFNGGTLLWSSGTEFPDNQPAFNYYGKDLFFNSPVAIGTGDDKRLFCDANPFANWSVQNLEVAALVRFTLTV